MDKLNTALDLYHLENHMNLLINTFLQQDFSFTHLWYFTDFIVNSNNISLTAVKFPVTVLATNGVKTFCQQFIWTTDIG